MPLKIYEKLNNIKDTTGCTIDDTLLVVCIYNPSENCPYRWPISKWENLVEVCRNSNFLKFVITREVNMLKTTWRSFISETNTKRKCFKHYKSYTCNNKLESPRSTKQRWTSFHATTILLYGPTTTLSSTQNTRLMDVRLRTTKHTRRKYTSNTTLCTGPQYCSTASAEQTTSN